MITDLTKGKPSARLVNLALPMGLSIIFQQLYNIADSAIVGRFVGGESLYAISASYSVTMIFLAVATGSSIGITVVAGKFFGAKKYIDLKTSINTAVIGILVVSAVFALSGAFLSEPILKLLKTPTDIMKEAKAYLQIFFYGLPFIYLYNAVSGAFAAIGDTKTTLYFLIFASLLNIGLDLLAVIVLKMGVEGAAYATLISQALSSVPAFFVLIKRLKGLNCEKAPLYSFAHQLTIIKIAVPSIIQHSIVSLGNLFIQERVNTFAAADISIGTAYSAAIKLNTFAINTFAAIGNATSSFTAQNLGGGEVGRVRSGYKAGVLSAVVMALPFTLCYVAMPSVCLKLFLDSSTTENIQNVITYGKQFLYIVSPFYALIVVKIVTDGVLRGGERMAEFMASTFLDLMLRVSFAYVFTLGFGMDQTGIWWAWPVGWIISIIVSVAFYIRGKWKNIAMQKI